MHFLCPFNVFCGTSELFCPDSICYSACTETIKSDYLNQFGGSRYYSSLSSVCLRFCTAWSPLTERWSPLADSLDPSQGRVGMGRKIGPIRIQFWSPSTHLPCFILWIKSPCSLPNVNSLLSTDYYKSGPHLSSAQTGSTIILINYKQSPQQRLRFL